MYWEISHGLTFKGKKLYPYVYEHLIEDRRIIMIMHILPRILHISLPSKRTVFIFVSKLLRNVLKRMKNQFFDFYFMSYWFCSQLSSVFGSWIFFVRFLVIQLWSILYITFVVHSGPRQKKYSIFYIKGRHPPAPVCF